MRLGSLKDWVPARWVGPATGFSEALYLKLIGRAGPATAGGWFPQPQEEPQKVLRAQLVGVTAVPRATGIDVLNDAIDRLLAKVRERIE